jgi:hypothetical protein
MLPWEQGKAGRKSALSLEGKKEGGRWVRAADAKESTAIREKCETEGKNLQNSGVRLLTREAIKVGRASRREFLFFLLTPLVLTVL